LPIDFLFALIVPFEPASTAALLYRQAGDRKPSTAFIRRF